MLVPNYLKAGPRIMFTDSVCSSSDYVCTAAVADGTADLMVEHARATAAKDYEHTRAMEALRNVKATKCGVVLQLTCLPQL